MTLLSVMGTRMAIAAAILSLQSSIDGVNNDSCHNGQNEINDDVLKSNHDHLFLEQTAYLINQCGDHPSQQGGV